jgi:hypothetical protein
MNGTHVRFALIRILALAVLSATAAGAAPAGPAGMVWVAATEQGTVEVFWLPTGSGWPAGGWRLERMVGTEATVLAEALRPGQDAAALAALSPEKADAIGRFADAASRAALTPEQRQVAEVVMELGGAADVRFGRALGVRFTDAQPGTRPCRYRVSALDGTGKIGASFTSREVDPTRPTAAAPPPGALSAATSRDGVGVTWADAPRDSDPPVVGYTVERVGADGKVGLRTPSLVVVGGKRVAGQPLFVDHYAPGEAEVVYRVQSVDVLGRGSRWTELRYYVQDLAALDPPKDLRAEGGTNAAKVSWTRITNPHTKGLVVSRSTLHEGPYSVLTETPLPPDAMSYQDSDLAGGASYFYKVQAVGPRGDLGPLSDPAMALPRNATAPPAVTGLKADVGTTRVHLTWQPVPFQVAGYFVERQSPGAADWVRMNARVTPEPRYDDFVGPSPGGALRYRIVAVAFDNQESTPSAVVEAALPDTVPPEPPRITEADGGRGVVRITFVPAPPEADTSQVLVLRGGTPEDPGLVIGDPLPGSARTFEDSRVLPGQPYFYRLVAVDPAGNRSQPSRPVAVRVGSPELPQPAAPTARLVTEPFPRVVIGYPPPPTGFSVVIQRRSEGEEGWLFIAGPTTTPEVADVHPPRKGKIAYRIVYQAGNGLQGPPSPSAEVTR